MPKLNAKVAAAVGEAEAAKSEFELLKPGKYRARLKEVEEKESQAGNDYWNVTFHEIYPLSGGEKVPGQQWYMLMLPKVLKKGQEFPDGYKPGVNAKEQDPAKAWKVYQDIVKGRIKAFFEAFGYEADSDTEEMYGEECVIQVAIETIQGGDRKGEKRNTVKGVSPLPANAGAAGSSDDEDDDF